jgi:hypothetical protein
VAGRHLACNHALMRTGVTEKGRLVETRRVADAMGLSPDSPPLPDWAASWTDADAKRPWPPGSETGHIFSNAALIINT